MEARELRRISVAEYVALDRASEERWEYVNGEAFAMAASPEHNVVKRNVVNALTRALEGRPCLAMPDGQKIATRRSRSYHYPDASVFCGDPIRDTDDDHALTNPTLIVEVLSPTTSDYDRGGKFVHYRSLESLREYLLVSLEDRTVERHRRLESGEWLMTEVAAGDIELPSIGVRLALADLWIDLDRVARST